jgi:hypothetical protein
MKESFEFESLDKELEGVLGRFRDSAHAWSAQEYAQVSIGASGASSRGWNAPLRWAVGACLMLAAVAIPVHRERVRQARQAQVVIATQQDAQLLEDVDKDVSRQVPASMSPLTSLIASDDPGFRAESEQ